MKTNDEKPCGGIADILFDEDNNADVVLVNEKEQELAFKQVYAAVLDGTLYCILSPVERVGSMSRDEAIAFAVSDDDTLTCVKDCTLSRRIFAEYYNCVQRGGR